MHSQPIAAENSAHRENSWIFQILLFSLVTLFTRLPFRSSHLFDHDSVQFALGMRRYDVYLHQPHPPGYFLYVQTAKLIDFFVRDANTSLVWLSVLASVLLVISAYSLASLLIDRRDGRWVALLTITSPMIWFHGEVALSYIVAAFFANWIGLIAWKLIKGDRRWLYLSPVALGVAAGFRQDLILFLGPLWFFAVTRFGWRATLSGLAILGATILAWFVPMIWATGGLQVYLTALKELWAFNNDTQSIWQSNISSPADTFWTLMGFLSYGVELGSIFLILSAYLLVRTGAWRDIALDKICFFLLWLAPALIFFTFVFIPPYKYSYGLVVVPAFVILIPSAVRFVLFPLGKLRVFHRYSVHAAAYLMLPALIVINILIFCFGSSGYSVGSLRHHDQLLTTIISGIKANFPSDGTVILGRQRSTISGFRHVQYYLPEYSVYLADQQTDRYGQKWHLFGALKGQTVLSKTLTMPPDTRYVVFVADPYFPETSRDLNQPEIRRIQLSSDYALYYKELPQPTSIK
jgi:hypothetical protein